jgi:hypothetical protein
MNKQGRVLGALAIAAGVAACGNAHPSANGNESLGGTPTVAQGRAGAASPDCDLDKMSAAFPTPTTPDRLAAQYGWTVSQLRNFFNGVCGSPAFNSMYNQIAALPPDVGQNPVGQVFGSWMIYCGQINERQLGTGAIFTPDRVADMMATNAKTSIEQARAEVHKMVSLGCPPPGNRN